MTPQNNTNIGSSRRWEILAFTSIGALMAPLSGSIIAVALPKMGRDLHLSFEGTIWVQASYLLTMAVLMIPLGRIADQRGRMKFYLYGTALFTLGSIIAAISRGSAGIIIARVVQGLGGALLSSTSSALVTAAFPANERGKAMGINVMAVYGGLSLGPPLGGFLVDVFNWHGVFLMNVPVGIAILLWGRGLRGAVDEDGAKEAGAVHKLDFPGCVLLGIGMLALLMPLTLHARWGLASAPTLSLFAVSVLSFLAFFMREKRAPEPLLDIKLLHQNPLFAYGNLAALLNYMGIFAVGMLTSVWLQLAQGFSAATAGWIMLGQPLVQALLSPVAGRLSDHFGTKMFTTLGMFLTALGMALLGCLTRESGFAAIIASLAVVGVGMASFSAPNTSSVMGSVRRDSLSLAGAVLGTTRVMGMTMSVAILGGLAASHLGQGGWQDLLKFGPSGPGADAFMWGYRTAMLTGAGFVLLGFFACLVRDRNNET